MEEDLYKQSEIFDFIENTQESKNEKSRTMLERLFGKVDSPVMQCANCLCERCVNNVENLWSKIRPEEQIISCFNCDECCYYTGGCNYKLQKKEDCEDFVISDYAAVSRRKKIKVL